MIPAEVESAIFLSIPQSFTFNGNTMVAAVEKAAIAQISDLVTNNDVAVTISYINEKEDPELTSPNHKMEIIQNADQSMSYEMGGFETCTLSMNIYISKRIRVPQLDLDGLMKAYMRTLDAWYYSTLRSAVEPIGRSTRDLTFLENGIFRYHLDVLVRYKVSALVTVETFDTVNWTATINQ